MPHGVCTSQVRIARLKAQCLAAALYRRTAKWWVRITPALAEQLEYERKLYAKRPSKAETITQLVEEGLHFRRANRPQRMNRPGVPPLPPKRKKPRRVPFVGLD